MIAFPDVVTATPRPQRVFVRDPWGDVWNALDDPLYLVASHSGGGLCCVEVPRRHPAWTGIETPEE